MKIYNADFQEIADYQPDQGRLSEQTRVIHHDAVEGVAEQGHWETVAEYPETGGKDVAWVVDVPGVKAQEAWDETERYLLFTPFTAEELEQMAQDAQKPTAEELLEALMGGVADA